MPVTRQQILQRGFANHCCNCGANTLFKPGTMFGVNESCANCGMKFDRGDGFFLGPFVINYGVTVFGFVLPVIGCYLFHHLSGGVTIALSGGGAILLPILLYRLSWSWWLTGYFYFLPNKLTANRGDLGADGED
jgi:uncharacterized protein (DUF983 family)